MSSCSTSCMEKGAGDAGGRQFFDSWCKTWHELHKQHMRRYIETMECHMRKQHSVMEDILTHEMRKQFQHMKRFSEESGNSENALQQLFSEESSAFESAYMKRQPFGSDSFFLSQQSTACTSYAHVAPSLQSAAQVLEAPQEPPVAVLGHVQIEGRSPTDLLEEVVQDVAAAGSRTLKKAVQEYRGAIGWTSSRLRKMTAKIGVAHGPVQNLFFRITQHKLFTGTVAFLILSNTILIAVEADHSMKNSLRVKRKETDWATTLEIVYTFLFLFELLLRILAERSGFFLDSHAGWNIFDVVVVASALVEMGLDSLNLTFLRGLRIFRMLRVVQVIRVLRVFRSLRLMVASIFSSALTLTWAFVLMLILVFCFAVCFLQGLVNYIVSEDTVPSHVYDAIKKYFPGLGGATYTLMSVISGGFEWEVVADLLWEVHPGYMYLFAFYIVFVLFGVLNIMTAVFVESAGDIAKIDNEVVIQTTMEQHESFLNQLEQLFIELDTDYSGTISWEEFRNHLEDPRMQAYFSEVGMDIHEAEGLYHLLDVDESGQVAIEEFMIGCMRLKGDAKSIDVASLIYDQKKALLCEKINFENMGHQLKSIEGHLEVLFMLFKRQGIALDTLVGNADFSRIAQGELVYKEEPKETTQAYCKSVRTSGGLKDGPVDSLSL